MLQNLGLHDMNSQESLGLKEKVGLSNYGAIPLRVFNYSLQIYFSLALFQIVFMVDSSR